MPSDPDQQAENPDELGESAHQASEQDQPISLRGRLFFLIVSLLSVPLCLGLWLSRQNPPLAPNESSLPERAQPTEAGSFQSAPTVSPTAPNRANPPSQPRDGASGSSMLSMTCLSGGDPEQLAPADPSNYGPRLAADWQGRPVNHRPALIVLHETVVDEAAALALFRSPHNSDGQQASYHVLIGRDGRRIRVVPDGERAFGAGDSDFRGLGLQLKPGLRPSVNNVALHVSLVSPPDGADGERLDHSGYTQAQYQSLASQIAQWLAQYGIQPQAVVTHQEVDRSGTRRDPRSFDWGSLSQDLRTRWLACGGSAQTANLGR